MCEGKAIDEKAMQERVEETKRIKAKMAALPMSEWMGDAEIRARIRPEAYNLLISKKD